MLLKEEKKPPETTLNNHKPKKNPKKIKKKKKNIFNLDGRTDQAVGDLMQIKKLKNFAHCRDVFNLDGGGSTTMWIKEKHSIGVLKKPQKKKTYIKGEGVSSIFLIKKKNFFFYI